ncbi:MAG: NAD(P)-dependent alcohol dehydrogenase [Anaerolineales bacterium]|nr:NAD(P)-dependent alcohol dehydrogenase [Anaerolineales bacterium]
MKAIVSIKYGSPDVMEFKEIAKPTHKDDEVLVKVYAAGVNAADWRWLRGDPLVGRFMYGLLKPKNPVLGADIAGVVEAVGANVTAFQPGDAVFGDLSADGFGGFAEYVCARADALALKPANITFEQAAAVPMAAVTALQGLRTTGKIQPGQKVLVNGASGGVGSFAVQIAKAFGTEVTAVVSTRNVAQARSLGADHVIDYTQEDFTQNGQQYDLILAANGYQPISSYKRALSPAGMYVMTGGSNAQMFQAMLLGPWQFRTGTQKMGSGGGGPNQKDLGFVRSLLAAGKIVPVIDRCYPLNQVADAIHYVETGHARGKVVITIGQN